MISKAAQYGLWCGVMWWLVDSAISYACEVYVKNAIDGYVAEAISKGEVRYRSREIMRSC